MTDSGRCVLCFFTLVPLRPSGRVRLFAWSWPKVRHYLQACPLDFVATQTIIVKPLPAAEAWVETIALPAAAMPGRYMESGSTG